MQTVPIWEVTNDKNLYLFHFFYTEHRIDLAKSEAGPGDKGKPN